MRCSDRGWPVLNLFQESRSYGLKILDSLNKKGAEAPFSHLFSLSVCLNRRFPPACSDIQTYKTQYTGHRNHAPFGKRRDVGVSVQVATLN